MNGENQVPLEILVKIDEALGRLEKFESAAKKTTGNASSSFDQLKTVAKAAVAVFAAKQVVDFFKSGIDAAIAQENAMRNLSTALKSTGEFSEAAMTRFKDFADQMEATTKYGDDAVLTQVAIAKSFGITNDQAEKLVTTAADLAAATGDTLDGAVQKLGKTYGGVTGKLDDMVPALRGLSKAQLANGDAVRVLADRYGGAANAEIKTFSGALLQTENAFGNLAEAFGQVIVKNESVIAAIGAIGDVLRVLEGSVVDNENAMSSLVSGGIKVIAATVVGVIDVVYSMTTAFQTTTRIITESKDTIYKWAKVLGIFNPAIAASVAALTHLADGAVDTATSFNEEFAKIRAAASLGAQKIFEADARVTKSGEEASKARKKYADAVVQDAKKLDQLSTAARSFEESLRTSQSNELANINEKLKQQLAQIQTFETEKVFHAKHAEELRVIAVETAMEKISKIHADAATKEAEAQKKATDDLKKQLDERRAAVEAAASNPAAFGVGKLGITPADLSPGAQQGIAAGAGVLNNALDGAAGAKNLISAGAGAFADTLIPGIGGVVGSIIGKLAEGPEATKKFIKEFVAAVPDIVEAIAESMPVVVEALVDSLINEGGALRIGIAITKAMAGEGLMKAIGKQLGLEFGRSFNAGPLTEGAKRFGGKVSEALRNGAAAVGERLSSSFKNGVASAGAALVSGFKAAVRAAGKLTATAIRDAFTTATRKMLIELPVAIAKGVFVTLPGKIREGFLLGLAAIKEGLANIISGAGRVLSAAGAALTSALNRFGQFITVDVPAGIARGFHAAIAFFQGLPAMFSAAGSEIAERLRAGAQAIIDGVTGAMGRLAEAIKAGIGSGVAAAKEAVGNFVANVKEVIGKIWEPIRTALDSFKFPKIELPGWLTKFVDSLDAFTETPAWLERFAGLIEDLTGAFDGGGGGGGYTPFANKPTPTNPLGFNRGGTIPAGYPNDSFPMPHAESGEMVIPRDDVRDLRTFLDEQRGGGGGVGLDQLAAAIADLAGRPVQVVMDGAVVARSVQRNAYRNARMTR